MKTCRVCKERKERTEFYRVGHLGIARRTLCKVCARTEDRAYRKKRRLLKQIHLDGEDQEAEEFREAIMDNELPIWERRLLLIKAYKLDMERAKDSPKIEKLLALHGLAR